MLRIIGFILIKLLIVSVILLIILEGTMLSSDFNHKIQTLGPRIFPSDHSSMNVNTELRFQTLVNEIEPNNNFDQAQVLSGDSPITVSGNVEVSDMGDLIVVDFEDDIEDMFKITSTVRGINIVLDNFDSDCDLYLIDPVDFSIINQSSTISEIGPETIDDPNLSSGTYLIGVTIFDADPIGTNTTAYELTVTGQFAGGDAGGDITAVRTLVYHQITSFTEAENPVGGQGWQHVISDNGNRIVWFEQINPKRVFVADNNGSNVREVANMDSDRLSHVDINAGGSKVAYIGGPGPSGHQVNSVNTDGSDNQVLITLNKLNINALRIAGDGSKIFFNVIGNTSIQGSNNPIERGVYMLNPDGSGLQQVVGPASIAGLLGIPENDVGAYYGFSNGPALDVSNDGSHIIFFAENDQTGQIHVFTTNSNGTGVLRLFGPVTSGGGVGISSDGNKVAFTVNNNGVYEGYTANFDGSDLLMIASNEQFTFTEGNSKGDQVSLTADGSKVLFDGTIGGYLFNSDGSGVLQLSANTASSAGKPLIVGSLERASMTSDGSRILFSIVPKGSSYTQLAVLYINPTSLDQAPGLSDLSSDPQYVVKDGSLQTTIQVKVNTSNTIDYAGNAVLLNGLQDNKVTTIKFSDDGVSGGDLVAGDGIFTHNNIKAFSDADVGTRTLRINAEVFSVDGRLHGTAVDYEPFAVLESSPTDLDNFVFSIPSESVLHQNYPNPFNPSTTINYTIPKQSNVTLKIFDVLGSGVAKLVNRKQPQGNYEIEFDGSELTSGIYFYRLQAGDFSETKKMILLK